MISIPPRFFIKSKCHDLIQAATSLFFSRFRNRAGVNAFGRAKIRKRQDAAYCVDYSIFKACDTACSVVSAGLAPKRFCSTFCEGACGNPSITSAASASL